MQKILSTIKERRSIRKFKDSPVDRMVLMSCIEAARLAPSADNRQPWRFIIIDEPEIKKRFADTAFSGIYRATRWAAKAPALIVLIADLTFITHKLAPAVQGTPFFYLDMGIAGEHIVLQAQSMGLSTCWIGWFNLDNVTRFLNLPGRMKVCQLMAVGYKDDSSRPRVKKLKPIDEIVSFNQWTGKLKD